jgi:pimeloyl-ACP methyl ester carboxylesterase
MWLGRIGYAAQRSGIGMNAGCPRELVEVLASTVDRVYASSGRKVTLIGHSLGGLLARGVALRRPGAVARVITLGSPVQGLRAHAAIAAAAQALGTECDASCMLTLQHVLRMDVEETNLFSAQDAVVDPATCVRDDAPSVEVRGSHVGLVVNVEVYRHLARILAVRPQRRVTPERIARLHHAPRREQLAA